MKVHQVASENLQAHGWDGANLYVQFKKTGAVYEYADVPEEEYEGFRNAPSLGARIHSHIKKRYVARLVSEGEPIMDEFKLTNSTV